MKKMLGIMLLANFFVGCGPQLGKQNYFNFSPQESKTSEAELVPFEQIKAPDNKMGSLEDKLQNRIAETATNWRLGRYDFPRPYPYLVSAAPYYCDPQRYPPSLVLGMFACQPYIPQIMQMGFYQSPRPGF
jgi:hypothetical protein